jgi:hypothetical protein
MVKKTATTPRMSSALRRRRSRGPGNIEAIIGGSA